MTQLARRRWLSASAALALALGLAALPAVAAAQDGADAAAIAPGAAPEPQIGRAHV